MPPAQTTASRPRTVQRCSRGRSGDGRQSFGRHRLQGVLHGGHLGAQPLLHGRHLLLRPLNLGLLRAQLLRRQLGCHRLLRAIAHGQAVTCTV